MLVEVVVIMFCLVRVHDVDLQHIFTFAQRRQLFIDEFDIVTIAAQVCQANLAPAIGVAAVEEL